MNNNLCPCNEVKRTQCILRNTDYGCDHYLLLTDDQIRLVKYLISEEALNSDIFIFIVLDGESEKFEKI